MTPVLVGVGRNIKNVAAGKSCPPNKFLHYRRFLELYIMQRHAETIIVPGFLANGIHTGIKSDGCKDLALIYSFLPARTAGVFTTNRFKAAPVLIDMERVKSGIVQAILVNSGNANAATGSEGYDDALVMSRSVSDRLSIDDKLVLVASTGIIGQRLPLRKITKGMKNLVAGLRPEGLADAEEAIMTTDKFPKISTRKSILGMKEITLCGIAKGAGMISPRMATMLAFFMTDADIELSALKSLFRQAVNGSFNAVTVDGCMSTNDTAIIMANGSAGNKTIRKSTKDFLLFREMLFSTAHELAQAIVRDGEGTTKMIEISVEKAASTGDAKKAAYAIADSNLVKTAFFGCDPNWGRILSAVGSVNITMSADLIQVFFEDVLIFANGRGVVGNEQKLSEIMSLPCIRLRVDLGAGTKSFRLCTSDLSYEYVKINSHYHT
jgi:glutamate N-acetyltransferase / amino-acid N-acetyltransferase